MADAASSARTSDNGLLSTPISQYSPSLPISVNAFYTFEDGSAYEGCFALCAGEADERPMYVQHGSGVYVKGNYIYSGEWRDGKMTHGCITFPSGDTYEGYLLDGLFHGWGRYTWYKQDKYYEGMWVNGLMEGPGTLSYVLSGQKSRNLSLGENTTLLSSSSGAQVPERNHYECKGVFGAGKYHHTPALQAALRDEYLKRYRRDFLGAAVEVLQQIETALVQNTSYSAYIGGGQSTSQGGFQMTSASAVAAVSGKSKSADAPGAAVGGATKKKPLVAPRGSTTGTIPNKDPFAGGACFTGGSALLEEKKYLSGLNEYVAEKYILPPFPSLNDFHVEGLSRLLTAARGYYETSGNTPGGAYSVEVRIPTNEQDSLELSVVDKARILNPKTVAGRGSGQIVEVILRATDGTGNIVAGVALVNCNDQIASPDVAHFRVVALVLPSPQQLRKLR